MMNRRDLIAYVVSNYNPPIPGAHRVGGIIFYIDINNATYNFYDSNWNEIQNVSVGDSPTYYTISGTPTKDGFYVFENNEYSDLRWTYPTGEELDPWKHEVTGTTDSLGSGKTNTALVMSIDDGAYLSSNDTIWSKCKALNDSNHSGCNDWYAPSETELELLRSYCETNMSEDDYWDLFGVITEPDRIISKDVWTSSEQSAHDAKHWLGTMQEWSTDGKAASQFFIPIRSF